jgi:SAM-dependent methyltransferase
MKKNNLKKFYQKIKNKKIKYFFGSKHIFKEISKIFNRELNEKKILDLGCGDLKNFGFLKKFNFESYTAVDWIDFKVEKIDKRIFFIKKSIEDYLKKKSNITFNTIVSIGTLEHFLNPWKILKLIRKKLSPKGTLIFAYPNYYNPRGFSLMVLKHLFNLKISLSDKYFFSPEEIKFEMKKLNYKNIQIKSIHNTGAFGEVSIKDLKSRLPKVFKSKKKELKPFLKFYVGYTKMYKPNKYSGQVIIVKAKR